MKTEDIKISDIKIVDNIRTKLGKSNIAELMTSIKQNGLKQPIGVGKTKTDEYVLIWGYRRMSACAKLGWKTIPAVVEDEPEFSELLIVNAIENLHRTDISPTELGRVCIKLSDLGLSMPEIVARLGENRTKITNCMKIFRSIPEKIRKRVAFIATGNQKKGKISATAMGKILTAKKEFGFSNKIMEKLADQCAKDDLNVRDITIIGELIKKGYTVLKAIERRKKYSIQYVQVLVENEPLNALAKKHDTNIPDVIRRIIHGKIKPLGKAIIE